MLSLSHWTWIWENSGRWWWTGKHGMLQSMGSKTVRHDLATEQQIQCFNSRSELCVNLRNHWVTGKDLWAGIPLGTPKIPSSALLVHTHKKNYFRVRNTWSNPSVPEKWSHNPIYFLSCFIYEIGVLVPPSHVQGLGNSQVLSSVFVNLRAHPKCKRRFYSFDQTFVECLGSVPAKTWAPAGKAPPHPSALSK